MKRKILLFSSLLIIIIFSSCSFSGYDDIYELNDYLLNFDPETDNFKDLASNFYSEDDAKAFVEILKHDINPRFCKFINESEGEIYLMDKEGHITNENPYFASGRLNLSNNHKIFLGYERKFESWKIYSISDLILFDDKKLIIVDFLLDEREEKVFRFLTPDDEYHKDLKIENFELIYNEEVICRNSDIKKEFYVDYHNISVIDSTIECDYGNILDRKSKRSGESIKDLFRTRKQAYVEDYLETDGLLFNIKFKLEDGNEITGVLFRRVW